MMLVALGIRARLNKPGQITQVEMGATSDLEAKAFVRLRRASGFLLNGQEKVTKEKATLLGACRAAPGKSVSRGRAFRQGILPWRKGADIPVDSPAGLSSTTHRLTRG